MSSSSSSPIIDLLNNSLSKAVPTNPIMAELKGQVIRFDPATSTCVLKFANVDRKFTQGRSVQGGILAAFLDGGAAYCMLCASEVASTVSTLEQKVSYLGPVPAGVDVYVRSTIVKRGKSVAFFESDLFIGPPTSTSQPMAKASQTALIVTSIRRSKEDGQQQQAKM